MIRALIILVIVLSPNIRGCAQADSVYNNKERQKMRNFDIKEFHANNDGAGYYKRVLSNVSIEKRSLHDADRNIVGYIEVCENLYTPYNYYYEYDKRGNLRRSLDYFDRFVIGKEYNYDSLGHVTKTIDHDKPYKFSLDDLIKKMKEEYGCDILDKERLIKVYRSEGKDDLHKPWYEVCCLEDTSVYYCNRYLIDGTTGETLYMENHENVMDDDLDGMRLYRAIKAGKPITIQDEYLYELKKKKGGQDEKGTKKKGKSFWRKLFD